MLGVCRLPPALSKELLDHLYLKQLTAVPLFHGLSEQVLAKLCFAMKPFKAMKYDYIFREGEVGRVSRHDIAGIWVALFSRCQRYRC